jgi:hypothetical protein
MEIASYLPDHIRKSPWDDNNPKQPGWRRKGPAESQVRLAVELICGRFFTDISEDDAKLWIRRCLPDRGTMHDFLSFHAKITEGNNELRFSDRSREDNLADGLSRIHYGRERDQFFDRWKLCGIYRGCKSSHDGPHHGVDPDYLPGGREFRKWGLWEPHDRQEEFVDRDLDY